MTSTKKYCTCSDPVHVLDESVFYASFCRNCGKPTFASLFNQAIAHFTVEARMRYQESKFEMKQTALGRKMYLTVCEATGDIAVIAEEVELTQEEKDELLTEKLRMEYYEDCLAE